MTKIEKRCTLLANGNPVSNIDPFGLSSERWGDRFDEAKSYLEEAIKRINERERVRQEMLDVFSEYYYKSQIPDYKKSFFEPKNELDELLKPYADEYDRLASEYSEFVRKLSVLDDRSEETDGDKRWPNKPTNRDLIQKPRMNISDIPSFSRNSGAFDAQVAIMDNRIY